MTQRSEGGGRDTESKGSQAVGLTDESVQLHVFLHALRPVAP